MYQNKTTYRKKNNKPEGPTLKCLIFFFFLSILLYLPSIVYSTPPNSMEDLLYTTLKITCKSKVETNTGFIEETNIGTGYIFNFMEKIHNISPVTSSQTLSWVEKPYLVTNKHVIQNATIGILILNISQNNIHPSATYPLIIGSEDRPFYKGFTSHPSGIDLCAYPLTGAIEFVENQLNVEEVRKYNELHSIYLENYNRIVLLNKAFENSFQSYGSTTYLIPPTKPAKINVFYRSLSHRNLVNFQTEGAIQDILIVGYPFGITDEESNLPIILKGITSSSIKSNFQNKSEVLVDTACFPGSSGSPVFLHQHFERGLFEVKFLGTLYAIPQYTLGTIMYDEQNHVKCQPMPTSRLEIAIASNIGFVIKSTELEAIQTRINQDVFCYTCRQHNVLGTDNCTRLPN